MSCSLLDSTQDASLVIAVEDAALFLRNTVPNKMLFPRIKRHKLPRNRTLTIASALQYIHIVAKLDTLGIFAKIRIMFGPVYTLYSILKYI